MRYYSPESYAGWGEFDNWDYHYLIFWLVVEIAFFYLNILSIFFFLIVSRIFSFHSLKDRAGFGGTNKKTRDFLEHASADIFWFTTTMTSILFGSYVLKMHFQNKDAFEEYLHKRNPDAKFEITFSLIGVCTKHVVNLVMLYFVFFRKNTREYDAKFPYKKMIMMRLLFCGGLSTFLSYHYL